MAKQRYSVLVSRGSESIGEYIAHATMEGLRQLAERMKPEFSFRILGNHGFIAERQANQTVLTRLNR